MASAQRVDPEVTACRTAKTNLRLVDVPFGPTGETLLCDVSRGQPRPLVPRSFRRRVFEAIHNLSHPSVRSSQKLVTSKFVWHNIRKDVGLMAKQCVNCQTAKIHTHVRAPQEIFEVPLSRFEHINVDIVGPLPESQGFRYLFTIVDRYTRWPEAIPITDTGTETCARALSFNWIARFGVPLHLTSYRGAQFTSEIWNALQFSKFYFLI